MTAALARPLLPAQEGAKRVSLGLALAVAMLFLSRNAAAQALVDLGSASNFVVLAGSGITIAGPADSTTITGDIGTYPTATITGLDNLVLNGTNHAADAVTQQAQADLAAAIADAAGRTPTTTYSPIFDLGGLTLGPGVYNDPSSFAITGTLRLDAGGDPNAAWIFQAGSTLVAASGSGVVLTNGAQAGHVFWQVGTSATLGTGAAFIGTILADQSITLNTGATLAGRVLARNGAVSLDNNMGLLPRATHAAVAEVWGEWTEDEGRVAWHTSSEWNTAGFFVYRVDPETGAESRLNDLLLPAEFHEAGAVYARADPEAREDEGGTYRLEEMELTGQIRDLGEHTVVFGPPPAEAKAARAEVWTAKASAAPKMPALAKAEGPSSVLKVMVRKEGIYGVGLPAIAGGMGLALEEVRAWAAEGSLNITSLGVPVPVLYDEGRGRLVFHGQATRNWYTRDAAYLISRGAGLAMPRREPGAMSGATVFPVQVRFEEDRYPFDTATQMPADFYYWDYIVSGATNGTGLRRFPLDLTGRTGDVALKIRLLGWSSTTNAPDHLAEFSFNGIGMGSATFDGQDAKEVDLVIPGSAVSNGVNVLSVEGVLQPGHSFSCFVVDRIDASFDRELAPLATTAHFRAGGAAAFSAAAFSAPLALALDEAGNPTWIADGNGALPAKAWTVSSENERFAVIEAGAVPMPEPEPAAADAWFLSETNRIDYLVIVSRALAPAAQELADYRAGQGLRVGVAVFEDVCDLMTDGLRTPEAIPELLGYARAFWAEPPWMAVLAGNGHYDYLGALSNEVNHLPPMLIQTLGGLFSSDGLLGDIDGDDLPDLAIGRLPALTAADLSAMIAKIKAYENGFGQAWQNQVMLAADAADAEAGDFSAANTRLAALAGEKFPVARIDLDILAIAPARTSLSNWFTAGAGFVHYTGHGGGANWSGKNLLKAADVAAMNNPTRPPITVALSCLAGRYEAPAANSLGELLMRRAAGGAVAVWASSGMSRNAPATELGEAFYRAVLQEGSGTLGLAIQRARRSLTGDLLARDTFATYNLLGDPALRIAGNTGGQPSDATFAQWRWQRFSPQTLTNAAGSGATTNNFREYALGGADSELRAELPEFGYPLSGAIPAVADGFILRWRRRTRHSDVDYQLFLSDDLSQWESRSADLQTVGVEPDPDGIMETVRTKVNRPDAMRVFIGVKASRK